MKHLQILLVSRSRPSRTWKLADRIRREIPGATICGVVQQPIGQLPLQQRLIAKGCTNHVTLRPGLWSKVRFGLHSLLEGLMHWVLWFVHGCPGNLNARQNRTLADLGEACRQAGCPFRIVAGMADPLVSDLIEHADLVVVLDQVSPDMESWAMSRRVLHARTSEGDNGKQDIQLKIDYYAGESKEPFSIASLAIPVQPFDGLLGLTLKADLILDDLLVATTKSLIEGSATHAAKDVNEWMHRMLSPYLEQIHRSRQTTQGAFSAKRYRRTWKLCLDTMLLYFPLSVARNWYYRWRGRYPVLILTHHLVADRPHRMAVSTEAFWRQITFLQRHYRIVSLADAVAQLRSGTVTAPTVVLTFDDGYGDNFVGLRAVAQEKGVPVALFLAAQPIVTHREFQHDLDQGITGFLPLTWNQVRYWCEQGAEFGSHTMTHADCGVADPITLDEEIIGSKRVLEERLSVPIRFFAFPFGYRENISLPAIRMAAATYSHFLSGFGGENFPTKETSPHLLRKSLYSSLWELELEIQSVFDLVDYGRKVIGTPATTVSLQTSPNSSSSRMADLT